MLACSLSMHGAGGQASVWEPVPRSASLWVVPRSGGRERSQRFSYQAPHIER